MEGWEGQREGEMEGGKERGMEGNGEGAREREREGGKEGGKEGWKGERGMMKRGRMKTTIDQVVHLNNKFPSYCGH